jgi:hypothetical protein
MIFLGQRNQEGENQENPQSTEKTIIINYAKSGINSLSAQPYKHT